MYKINLKVYNLIISSVMEVVICYYIKGLSRWRNHRGLHFLGVKLESRDCVRSDHTS